jgi:FkbM family methyltransferase
VSYAQNGEDVVLWRALESVSRGRYVEVGANDPTVDSISRPFYDRGWSGLVVEPVPALAEAYRSDRPRDVVVEAAITSDDVDEVVLHLIENTGLSTLVDEIGEEHQRAGFPVRDVRVPARSLDDVLAEHLTEDEDIHFLVVDTEGTEAKVLQSVDLSRWRPWILVIEATAPRSDRQTHTEWESDVLAAGYQFCLFDGLSRWYVAKERAELAPALGYPACALDRYIPLHWHRREEQFEQVREELGQVREELVRWRGTVLARWADAVGGSSGPAGHEVVQLREELAATRATVSWRVTAPLRAVQERRLRGWR